MEKSGLLFKEFTVGFPANFMHDISAYSAQINYYRLRGTGGGGGVGVGGQKK